MRKNDENKLGHERRTRMWLGCRQQEATEADLILSRFRAPPLILHNFSKSHKKNILRYFYILFFSLFFSFVAILCGAGLYSSQEPGSRPIPTWTLRQMPSKYYWKKSLFSISFANFPNLLFSRLGLLPVLVLLLYNPDYHRFRGLCGSSTGAQLDKKSWLCCHQVCSWWGQRVQLILKININDNTLCWPFFRKLLLSAVGSLCCGLLCQSSCS